MVQYTRSALHEKLPNDRQNAESAQKERPFTTFLFDTRPISPSRSRRIPLTQRQAFLRAAKEDMVSVSDTMPAYTTDVLIANGLSYDYDMKRAFENAGGLDRRQMGMIDASLPRALAGQELANPAGIAAALGLDANQGQQLLAQQVMLGQLNPTQPAFMPAAFQQAAFHQPAFQQYGYPSPDLAQFHHLVADSPNSATFSSSPNGFIDMPSPSFSPAVTFAGSSPSMSPQMPMANGLPMMGFMGGAMPYPPTAQNGYGSRTVYVGNLPPTASVDELLSQVRFGPIDSVKILPEKSCAFISFLEPMIAAAFHSDMVMRKIQLHGQELKIGWGKSAPLQPHVLQAVAQAGATRNVYLGNLDEDVTEQSLRDELSHFGPIDQVKIVRDKSIGFVHFLSIANAMKVVQVLPAEPGWEGKRVNYGKDRCAYVPKNQHQQQAHNLAAAQMAANYAGSYGLNLNLPNGGIGAMPGAMSIVDQENLGNRTVYLGNLHPDTTVEEICNSIRGGILQQIRYIPDKHICFVTFVDPNAALAFYTTSMAQGINIHARRLKIGWGKHSGPPPPGISMVVQAGGSRNIYIGNIADFDEFSEERLRADFGVHGDIELVNMLKEKNCAFVNFTQISYAIKALEAIKQDPAYQELKIAYGKDRCGNLPRSGFGFGGGRSGSSQGGRSPRGRSPMTIPSPSPPPIVTIGEAGLLAAPPTVEGVAVAAL